MKYLLKHWLKGRNLFIPLTVKVEWVRGKLRSFAYQLILFPQRGSGFSCNYCGAIYSRFVGLDTPEIYKEISSKYNVIEGYGANNICPRCLSTSRVRLLKIAIEHFFKGHDKNILHFAPTEKVFALLQRIGRVTTIDLQPAIYKHIDPNVIHGDATQLRLESESYDFVVANHVLEHIPNDIAAMKEIYRVLKKGGTALLQVPYSEFIEATIEQPDIKDPQLQFAMFGQSDHVRLYSLKDYVRRLQKAGFEVEIIGDNFLKAYQRFALQHEEVIVLAHKR